MNQRRSAKTPERLASEIVNALQIVGGMGDTSNMRSNYCPDCGNYGRIHGPVQDVFEGPMRGCRFKGFDMRKWSPDSIDAMLRQEVAR